MGRELDFYHKLDHYNDDTGPTKDLQRIQPRGRQLKKLVKRVAGEIARNRFYLEVRPGEGVEEVRPQIAEAARAALEWEFYHGEKEFEDVLDRVVEGSLAARMWCAQVGYDPTIGPYGEIYFESFDGRTIGWEPGFHTPHNPRCSWVWRDIEMTVGAIEAMKDDGWKDTEGLTSDSAYVGAAGASSGSHYVTPSAGTPRISEADNGGKDGRVLVTLMWERNVRDRVKREKPGTLTEWEPGQRFMACGNQECGWRSYKQGQTEEELPQSGMCPHCGGPTERVDGEVLDETALAYRRGKRFLIFSRIQKRLFVNMNGWPHNLKTLPLLIFKPDDHPLEEIGGSMTFDHWTMQVAANVTMRLGLEHMKLAKPYMMGPWANARDVFGQPWQFLDEQGLMIDADVETTMAVRPLQAGGLPPAWNTLNMAIDNVFSGHTSTAELGITPQNSKDIAASTVQQFIEQGNIWVDHVTKKFRRACTPFVNATYQLIQATYLPARWRDFQGEDGMIKGLLVAGDSLPNMNVIVTTTPEMKRLDQEELQSIMTLGQMAQTMPYMVEIMAKKMGIEKSEVQDMLQKKAEWEQEMAEQQMQQAQMAAEQQSAEQEQQFNRKMMMEQMGAGREDERGERDFERKRQMQYEGAVLRGMNGTGGPARQRAGRR